MGLDLHYTPRGRLECVVRKLKVDVQLLIKYKGLNDKEVYKIHFNSEYGSRFCRAM